MGTFRGSRTVCELGGVHAGPGSTVRAVWGSFHAPRLLHPGRRPMKLQELHPKRFFLETWQRLDEESAAGTRTGYDWQPLVVLCVGAACLSLMEYYGGASTFHDLLDTLVERYPDSFWATLPSSPHLRLVRYVWWAGWRFLGYFLLPALALVLMRRRVVEYGLEFRNFREHAWIYVLAYLVVLVGVIAVSFTDSFSSYYPFYKLSSRSWMDWIAWELLYAVQFFSLEFFFRGMWLNALKPSMGSQAIFVSVVPYCMIHFGKPFIETVGAIVAGVVLGTLAMKTRSIWSGFLIHISVAISMDAAAMLQTSGLPNTLFPEYY